MLVITRQPGESFVIFPNNTAKDNGAKTYQISITLKKVKYTGRQKVELAISAPDGLRVMRGELKDQDSQ